MAKLRRNQILLSEEMVALLKEVWPGMGLTGAVRQAIATNPLYAKRTGGTPAGTGDPQHRHIKVKTVLLNTAVKVFRARPGADIRLSDFATNQDKAAYVLEDFILTHPDFVKSEEDVRKQIEADAVLARKQAEADAVLARKQAEADAVLARKKAEEAAGLERYKADLRHKEDIARVKAAKDVEVAKLKEKAREERLRKAARRKACKTMDDHRLLDLEELDETWDEDTVQEEEVDEA